MSQQEGFVYSPEHILHIRRTLSEERFGPYLRRAGGDPAHAVQFYEWNTALSESLYGLLQGLEVALRNSMHGVLTAAFQTEFWFDTVGLLHPQQEAVAKARRRLAAEKRAITAGKLVAELSFGFWTGLTGHAYAQRLWIPHLHRAFPNARLGHKRAHERLDAIRLLRNRIAHHEPVLDRDLANDVRDIGDTIAWICPVTAQWVLQTNGFWGKFERYRIYMEESETRTS